MSFYVGLKNTATKLLTDKGQNVSWLHDNNNGSFNPVTGVKSGGSTTAYSAKGVLLYFSNARIDGVFVIASDRLLVMSAGNVPEVSDVVTVDSTAYQVLAVDPLNPAGIVVKYELQLRA